MADVSIDATVSTATARGLRSVVFTTPLIGYWFYIDSDGIFGYSKTTDGGATWGAQVDIDTTGFLTDIAFDVWYDRWTPGDAGTKIHTWFYNTDEDDVRWRSLDTNGDTLGTARLVSTLASAVAGRGVFVSGTKTRSGYLYCAFDIDAGAERGLHRSTDSGTTWSSNLDANFVEATIDQCLLFPASNTGDDNDCWAVYHDASADALTLKMWDSSAGSATESATIQAHIENTTDLTGQMGFSASVRHSDGHLILAAVSERDTATADHQVFDINGTGSIVALTAITTNIDDHYYPAVFIDQATDHIYVAYNGNRAGLDTLGTTTKVYYQKSTDGGTTWGGGNFTYMEGAAAAVFQVWAPLMGPRFYVGWRVGTTLVGNKVSSVVTAMYTRASDAVSFTDVATAVRAAYPPLNLRGSAWVPAGNPTTGFTCTIDAAVQAGDLLFMAVTSRDSTAGSADVTCVDNDVGGNAWAVRGNSSNKKLWVFWKRATAATAGKTITIAACVGSASGVGKAFSGGFIVDPPYSNLNGASPASGDELVAGFTPTYPDTMLCAVLANIEGAFAVTGLAWASAGVASAAESLSTGGSDCATAFGHVLQPGGPAATGLLTWSQTDGAGEVLQWSVRVAVPPRSASVFDAVGITDNTRVGRNLGIVKADAVTVAEAFVRESLVDRPIRVLDVATAVLVAAGLSTAVSDSVTVTDNARVGRNLGVVVADAVGVSDSARVGRNLGVVVSDAVSVTDSARVGRNLGVVVNDPVSFVDSARVGRNLGIVVNDASTVTEAQRVGLNLGIVVSDASTGVDSARPALQLGIVVNDAVTVAEFANPALQLAVRVNDAVGVADSARVGRNLGLVVNDAVTVADSARVGRNLGVVVNDAVSVTDSARVGLNLGVRGTITTAAVTFVTDSALAVLNPGVRASDDLTVTDDALAVINPGVYATDAVGVTESVQVVLVPAGRVAVVSDPQGWQSSIPTAPLDIAYLEETYDHGYLVETGSPGNGVVAQEINPTVNGTLYALLIPLVKDMYGLSAGPLDSVVFTLRSDSEAGPVLATAEVQAADIPVSPSGWDVDLGAPLVEVVFDTPVALAAGTSVWLTFLRSGAADSDYFYAAVGGVGTVPWLPSLTAYDGFPLADTYLLLTLFDRPTTIRVQDVVQAVLVIAEPTLFVNVHDDVAVAESTQAVLPQVAVHATDPITVTDTARPAIQLGISLAEALTVAENLRAELTPTLVQLHDVITATDSPHAALTPTLLRLSEGLTVTDSPYAVLSPMVLRLAEILAVADDPHAALTPTVLRLAELLTVIDDAHAAITPTMLRLADLLAVTEAVTFITSPTLLSVSDDVLTTDDALALLKLVRLTVSVSDVVTATESWTTPLTPLIARLDEIIAVAEALLVQFPTLVAYPAESVTAVEDVVAQLQTVRLTLLATDTVGVSEQVQTLLSVLMAAVAESLNVTDAVLAELTTNEIRLRLEEIINVTEFAKAVLDKLAVHANEAVTVVDLLQVAFDVLVARPFDAITVADALRAVLPLLTVHADDSVTVEDRLTTVLTPTALQLAETISLSEYVNAALSTFSIASFESITVVDVVLAFLNPLLATPSEALTVEDALTAVLTPTLLQVTDAISTVEFVKATFNRFVARPFEAVTLADAITVLLQTVRLTNASSEAIAVAEAVTLAATRIAKPYEQLTLLDVVRAVLTPSVKSVADVVSVVELARVVLTPFFSRPADSVSVVELVRTVLTPLAIHPADVITASDAVMALLAFAGAPIVMRQGVEVITVAEFVKPVLPSLHGRPVESLTVGEVLRVVLNPLGAVTADAVLVQEYIAAIVALAPFKEIRLHEMLTVQDVVILAFTAIAHLVTGDLRAEGPESHVSGGLAGRGGSGSLHRVPSLAGTLRHTSIPVAQWASGRLRSVPSFGGTIRRLPPGVAARPVETTSVRDQVAVELVP